MSRSQQAVLLLLTTISVTGCLDTTLDAKYPTTAAAIADGAITRGWVPEWIPVTATNLREVHNLDTNVSALTFDLPNGSRLQLPGDCKPITFPGLVPSHFNRSWWPTPEELRASYVFSRCKSDASTHLEFVGIHKTGQRGLHWRAYAR
ncbi:hypothetical protein FB548_0235 [Pseudoxanthomonas sp. 3HH-4]|nr:hypothetical protein FB548_0235 [Pseudoxanthomonas sp. 3HH-4]